VVDLLYEHGHPGDAVGITKGDAAAQLTLQEIVDRTRITPTQVTDHAAKVDPGNKSAGSASERIARETKSDRAIPDIDQAIAEVRTYVEDFFDRTRIGGRSIPEIVSAYQDLRDALLRPAIEFVFGEGAQEKLNEFVHSVRDKVHRYIEESNEGLSTLEIKNRKAIVDLAPLLFSMVEPVGRLGIGPVRPPPRSLRNRVFPASEPDDWGDFPIVEVKTTKLRSSNAPSDTPEYDALNTPAPNTIYRLDDGTTFRTNIARKVDRHEFIPVSHKRGRGTPHPDIKASKSTSQHIGHAHGAASDGPSDLYNRFLQDSNFNQGVYNVLESYLRKIKAERVNVDFIRRRDPASFEPDELFVRYLSKGKWYGIRFTNASGGG
jgi:hypothetical protein